MPTIAIDNEQVFYLCVRDWRMAHLIDQIDTLEYSKPSSAFSSLAHSIIEQMLSMKLPALIKRWVQDLRNGCITTESLLDTSVENLRYYGVQTVRLVTFVDWLHLRSLIILRSCRVRLTMQFVPCSPQFRG